MVTVVGGLEGVSFHLGFSLILAKRGMNFFFQNCLY